MNATAYRIARRALWLALIAVLIVIGVARTASPVRATAPPTVSIAQYPLTVAVPAHPQVLIAIGNSESMDGDLSGAIMTGSGALADSAAAAGLANSSSPVNYQIPPGFTPPLNAGSGGYAPYTVTTGGVQYDNSASRLNVAKAGITAILNDYIEYADFGLEDYNTTGNALYTTWVYYMSPSTTSNFTFTNTAATNTLANPCYGANVTVSVTRGVTSVTGNGSYNGGCATLLADYGVSSGAVADQYIVVGDTSDDPAVNDVFYAANGYQPPVCVSGSPSVTSPYTHWNLGQFNVEFQGGYPIIEDYDTVWGSGGYSVPCDNNMVPTNAGYIPYTNQVYQAERGFGYGANQSATTGTILVGMKSSGAIPTPASTAAAIAYFTPYLAAETNSLGTSEIKASAGQSPIYGLLASALTYYTGPSPPPSSNGCAPTRYVVLVTDGLPTLDKSNDAWPPLGTVPGNGYGVTATFKADGSLNTTNDQALQDTIAELAALQSANIKTYIIGLGAGVETAANPQAAATLTAMAVAGGTGSYFAATSPADLTNDMQAILANILAETAATSASAINSTGISTTSVAYQGTFTTSDVYQDWTGNLLAYKIDPSTGYIDTSYSNASWQAQVVLDGQNWTSPGRLITTWDPVTSKGIPFEWSTSTTATSGIASTTALGQALETFTGDTNGQDVLNYLRGDSDLEQRNHVGQFRSRAHKLGDIVDSSPLYVAGPSGPWQQASYFTFESRYYNRQPMIYIGANDGMLHAFNASTGHEVFAFVPHAVWSNLINLASPYYNPQHRFYVDASPQAADVQFASDSSWHTVLFGAERGGGNSIFAMDVTDPSQFSSEAGVASSVLWEFTDANMGYTYSEPVAVNTAAGFAVMFGNGYDSPTAKPFLYALNPQSGAVMAKIDLCAAVPSACNLSLPNGLSNITSMSTTGALLSGNPNVIYAGDLQGNLWRVDISSTNPSDWTVSVLFQATDPSGNRQPITVTPQTTMNPLSPNLAGAMVYFGTGQLLGLPDLGTTQVQTVYGVFDGGTAPATPYTRTSLVQQTMTAETASISGGGSTTIRLLSSNPVNLPANRGWFVDLSLDAGERVITDPALFNGTLQITTYQPNSNTCVGGGNAYYMVFNYATGGATTLPQFDWYGSGSINNSDLYSGQTVAGASLGNSYAAAPKMVTLGDQAIVYITTGAAQDGGQCNGTTCDKNELNADQAARGAWEELK